MPFVLFVKERSSTNISTIVLLFACTVRLLHWEIVKPVVRYLDTNALSKLPRVCTSDGRRIIIIGFSGFMNLS